MAILKIIMPVDDSGRRNELVFDVNIAEYGGRVVWDLIYTEMKKDALESGETEESFEAQMPSFKMLFIPRGVDDMGKWLNLPVSALLPTGESETVVDLELSPQGKAIFGED